MYDPSSDEEPVTFWNSPECVWSSSSTDGRAVVAMTLISGTIMAAEEEGGSMPGLEEDHDYDGLLHGLRFCGSSESENTATTDRSSVSSNRSSFMVPNDSGQWGNARLLEVLVSVGECATAALVLCAAGWLLLVSVIFRVAVHAGSVAEPRLRWIMRMLRDNCIAMVSSAVRCVVRLGESMWTCLFSPKDEIEYEVLAEPVAWCVSYELSPTDCEW